MPSSEGPRVSLVIRTLAWVIVFFTGLALLGLFHSLIEGKDVAPIGWGHAVIVFLGSLIIVPLSFYVAVTGRPPRWWKYLEEATDLEKPLGQKPERRDEQ